VHFSKDPKTTPGPKTIPLQSLTTTPKKKKEKTVLGIICCRLLLSIWWINGKIYALIMSTFTILLV